MPRIAPLLELLKEGVRKGVFPGAVCGIFYQQKSYILAGGFASLTPFLEPVEEESLYDLASLTKPLALGVTLMKFLDKKPLFDLERPLGKYLEVDKPLSEIPLFRFLNHTSGLSSWYPFYKEKPLTLEKIFKRIKGFTLEYEPGKGCLYSDLNFYLFTYFLERVYDKPFEELFEEAKREIPFSRRAKLIFKPLSKGIDEESIVPTSFDSETQKILRGIVEDENTRALSGVSGVAGLFGNVYGVMDLLIELLKAYKGEKGVFNPDIVRYFFDFRDFSSEFSLTFMRPTKKGYSATGGAFSEKTVGHLGYTGCSFFIDLERELIVILLTNRVHPKRGNEAIKEFRPIFHQKVIECIGS
ncbi:MAG: serine hydrolase domain-containing protein [Caldimicrobium sp.]